MAQQITGAYFGLVLGTAQKSGTPTAAATGWNNELLTSKLLPDYAELVQAGVVFYASSGAGAVTGFTGTGGGTPSIAVYNPTSGSASKNYLLLAALAAPTTMLGTAGTSPAELYLGPSVKPSANTSAAYSMLTGTQSGSSALAVVNAAMTSSTAINLVGAIGYVYWATAAAAAAGQIIYDPKGLVVVAPGNLLALGFRTNAGSLVADASLIWAELPA